MGMKQLDDDGGDKTRCVLEFGPDQAKLVLEEVGGGKVDHKTAFGRIAFAVPSEVNCARMQMGFEKWWKHSLSWNILGVAWNPVEDGVRGPGKNPNAAGQSRHAGQSHGAGNDCS